MEGSGKNHYRRGDCLRMGAWTECRSKGRGGGGLAKKTGGGVFERGVDTPMHTMLPIFWI